MVRQIPSFAMCLCCLAARAELLRQADWQFQLKPVAPGHGYVVSNVSAGTSAARAGVQTGDLLVSAGGQPIRDGLDLYRMQQQSKGGRTLALELQRGGVTRQIRFVPRALPLETHPDLNVTYDSARTAAGHEVRLVITRPRVRAGRLPVLVFIPWLSCDPVDYPDGPQDGWSHLLTDLARQSNALMVRIEKPGTGDSMGAPCVDNDLEADLDAFRAGLRRVAMLNDADPSQVVLVGGSIGASLVPVLAQQLSPGLTLRGIAVTGGHTKSWYQHMLELERRRLAFEGMNGDALDGRMRQVAAFYALYLKDRLTPGDVLRHRPELASVWSGSPDHQYERPAAYFHQLQSLDIAAAWARIAVPTLIVHGDYDWIMSKADAEIAASIVNRAHPGLARVVIVPGMGHNIERFETAEQAFKDQGARYEPAVASHILQWLGKVNLGAK